MVVLATIAALALLIVVHEMGHFLAARLQGIHVNRFSIGFGPVLWKYQGPETEYALRAIPLGGFVGFPDDDPDSEIPEDDPNLLRNRPVLDRAIVISAGVIANLIFAYFIFVLQFGALGVPTDQATLPGVLVPQVATTNIQVAAAAGIKDGDVIVAANGVSLGRSLTNSDQLKRIIESSAGQPVDLTIQRDGQTLDLEVVPQRNPEGKGQIGVSLRYNGSIVFRRAGAIETLSLAAQQFQDVVGMTLDGFVLLISRFGEVADQVAGPVKIVEQGAKMAASDVTRLLPFTALISINLAIINILPLPALDGGQLVFLLIEALRGKPLPARIQENVMQTGLVLLLGLGIFLIVRDTSQLEIFHR